jgi:hypothetical protein
MSNDCFWCGDLNLYTRIGDKMVLEAIRGNVFGHGDIGLKLCLLGISLRAVELLDIE